MERRQASWIGEAAGARNISYADMLRCIPEHVAGGGPADASGPTRNSYDNTNPRPSLYTTPHPPPPGGTHAMRRNGHTRHTPQTQVGVGWAHDALATRRTERRNGQAEGCYEPASGKRPCKLTTWGPTAASGEGSPTASMRCPLGRTWPTARAVMLLRVDPTQSSGTGTVRGLRWHRRTEGKEGGVGR